MGGGQAFATRAAATRALSRYYFQSMTDGNHSDSLEDLEQLAKAESSGAMSDPAGFLATLHSSRGDEARSRKPLSRDMKLALQILSDDQEYNDAYGFSIIKHTLLRIQDLRNSAAALSFCGAPDLVADCLMFEAKPNEMLAYDIVQKARTQVPDSGKQLERVQAAVAHVRVLLDDAATPLDEDKKNTYLKMQSKLTELQRKIEQEGVDVRLGGPTYCDGAQKDGKECGQAWDCNHDMYQCLYCTNMAFCEHCWARLVGEPDAQPGVDIFVCSAKHKWLKVPRTGSDLYVGPKAQSVRVPTDMRPAKKRDGSDGADERVLEIYFDEESEEVPLQTWKDRLATAWGFSLDEITEEMQRVASPTDSAGQDDLGGIDGALDE